MEKLRFATTDASVIYFKNIRQSEYQKEELTEAGAYRFTHKEATSFTPSLLLFWRNSQAYLLLPDSLQTYGQVILKKSDQSDTLAVDLERPSGQTHFAVLAYNHLLENGTVCLCDSGQTIQLLDDTESREVFRRVVFDFLRLVELR